MIHHKPGHRASGEMIFYPAVQLVSARESCAGWSLLAFAEPCLGFLLREFTVLISGSGSSSTDLGIQNGTVVLV